jgi:hypothetical protein
VRFAVRKQQGFLNDVFGLAGKTKAQNAHLMQSSFFVSAVDPHIGLPDGFDGRHQCFITFGSGSKQFGRAHQR